jgi:pantothenate kinase
MKTEALASLLADRIQQIHSHQKPARHTLIALAGGPGSGKTFIASTIAQQVTKRGLKAQAVSIEGFVKPSHILAAEEKQYKGAIDIFDGDAVVALFKKLRELEPGRELSCPGVDEENKFEPIPDGEEVHADKEVVVFEGIYMLADREPYTQLKAPLVDERWFIDVKAEIVGKRVAERRLAKGKAGSMEESLRTYDESDSKNTRWIGENVAGVYLRIHIYEECSITWPDGRVEK